MKGKQEYSSSLQTSEYLACVKKCVYNRPDEIVAPSRSTTYQTHKIGTGKRKILKAMFYSIVQYSL